MIRDKQLVQQLTVQWQRKHFTQATENPLGSTEWNDELTKKEVQEKIHMSLYFESFDQLNYHYQIDNRNHHFHDFCSSLCPILIQKHTM